MTAVMWFRRDLRLGDNPALLEAASGGRDVVALFVVDPRLWMPAGERRRAFLAASLRALDEDVGGRLVVRVGDPAELVPALVHEVDADAVYAAEDFGPYGSARDAVLDLELVGSPYAVPPGEVRTANGGPFKVFTPFSRAWQAQGWPQPTPAPDDVRWLDGLASDTLPEVDTSIALPAAGEAAAQRAVDAFLGGPLATYDRNRDRPDLDRTSRLSPYLKWGAVHPRQLLARLGGAKADEAFRTELCWREFYADVLHHRPDTARQAFNRSLRDMRVDCGPVADERFEAWAAGMTGFPLVDAGMRQLLAEGWMHNRVRMVTASFLVKDLHLDWTRGARWFMAQLVDGDLASNQHGWQWVAGTGTDAAPYFRIFNPVSQSKTVDPEGDYIRRYVPELRNLAAPAIHEPWTTLDGAASGYPAPIVDHTVERIEALARYDDVRAATRTGSPNRRRSRG